MNGSAKVKLFAVAIVAVLAMSAVAITITIPSDKTSSEEELTPDVLSSEKNDGQSESLKMLLNALNICNFYIGEVDETQYTYVFGDGGKNGMRFDVSTNSIMYGSILLNSNAVVDFTYCKELVMYGADICINGTNIKFTSDDDKTFEIMFQNGAGMKIGSNIEMCDSSSIVSSPFTINYSNGSSELFDDSGDLGKTLTVDSSFSINLDDDIKNGSFTITNYQTYGDTSQHEYNYSVNVYTLSNKTDAEVSVSVECDFTEYYKSLSETEQDEAEIQSSSVSFTDWLEHYFLDEHIIPDADISFFMNGLSMAISYEEIYQNYGDYSYTYSERNGKFELSNVNNLRFSVDSSSKNRYQEINASVDDLVYKNTYTERTFSIGEGIQIGDKVTCQEDVTAEGFEFSITDSSLSVDRTTIGLNADSIVVSTTYDYTMDKHVMRYALIDTDLTLSMNKNYVRSLYSFVIEVFAGSDLLGTLLSADYASVFCDAVIALTFDRLNIHEESLERALDSENKLNYVPKETSKDISFKDIVFDCDYYTSDEIKLEFDMPSLISTEKYRTMESVSSGRYVPTLAVKETESEINGFVLESEFELSMVNNIIGYVITAASNEDTSGIQIKNVETKLGIDMIKVNITDEVGQAQVTKTNSNWNKNFNDDELFPNIISSSETAMVLYNLSLEKRIEESQEEIGSIMLGNVVITGESKSSDSTNVIELESGMSDIYCDIDSQIPKLVPMVFALIDCMSNEDTDGSFDEFLYGFILDKTNLEMTVSLNKIYLDYTDSVSDGSDSAQICDELHFYIGEDNYSGDGKAVTMSLDLNAGNGASRVGYHNSSASVSMSDDSIFHYSLGYTTEEFGTQANEYSITGLNGTAIIDSTIHIDATLVSDVSTSTVGFENVNMSKTISDLSNVHIVADVDYDKFCEILAFFDDIDSEESMLQIISEEYSELLSGVHINMTCANESYSVESILTYHVGTELSILQEMDGYVIDNYSMDLNYLNNHYFSVKFDHICSSSYTYEGYKSNVNTNTTRYRTVDANMYDVDITADTELSGLNDFLQYAMQFLSGDSDDDNDDIKEYLDLSVSVELNGRNDAHEYELKDTQYNVFKSFDSKNKVLSGADEDINAVRETIADFDYIIANAVLGTSGTEQISIVSDGLYVKNDIISDNNEVEIVLDVDYTEISVGTDSRSLYKLVVALFAYENDIDGLDGEIRSALVSFVTDNTNTKFIIRLTSGEFYVKDKEGITGSEYRISIPKSSLEKFALTIESSVKVVYTDDFEFTMSGTYFKMNMAEDSKIIISDSYGGNIYLEYFEFTNLDAAVNVDAAVNIGELTQYFGDQNKIIKCITDAVMIKGVITADSGKYTSIRTETEDSMYYKIQVGSDEDLMIRIDTNLTSFMAAENLTDNVFLEGGDAYIQSEYTETYINENAVQVKNTVREIFKFEQFKAYLSSGQSIVESDSVNATVTIVNEINNNAVSNTYGMKTDGTVYFNNEFPSMRGYSIVAGGKLLCKEGYGVAPVIKVDTFTVSSDSVLYGGRTFIKGTELALTEDKSGNGIFAGWKVNDVLVPKDAKGATVYYSPTDDNITISYVYGYILTYKSDDSDDDKSVLKSVILNVGDEIDLGYTPEKTGFTFQRWNTDHKTMPAYNLAISAIWVPNTYVLTIDYANGSPKQISEVQFDMTITEPATPVREGYTFSGWLNYKENMVMPAYDLTIKALWSKKITTDLITSNGSEANVNVDADIADLDTAIIEALVSMAQNSNASLNMNFSGAFISMSADSLKKLSYDEITGKSSGMKMSVTKSEIISDTVLKTITSENKGLLSNVKYAISIDIDTNGCTNGLGRVTVAVPVDDSYIGSTFLVYYISTDGTITEIEAECKEVNGQTCVVFETDHFSYFALSQTSAGVDESEESSSSSPLMYVAIGAACVLIIGIIVFVILKRRYII